MKDLAANLFFFAMLILVSYFVYTYFQPRREGLEGRDDTPTTDGIAGNAATRGAGLKAAVVLSQDKLLISKYRADYENVILNTDDLVNTLMLETVLNIDKNDPIKALDKLTKLNQSKIALNSVMKYVDSSH
jgi:hypothetical protein